MYVKLINILIRMTSPVSHKEDQARSEFIFNILLLSTIVLSFSAFLINFRDFLRGQSLSISALTTFLIFIFFVFLYFLSKTGYSVISSGIFITTFFVLNSYIAIRFGIDIPACLITYALIIVMSSILIGTRFAFAMTALIILLIAGIGYLQLMQFFPAENYWRLTMVQTPDLIIFSVIFSIIAIVSWLSNREIEKSLRRARRSEAELTKERDSLEVKVEERTREIKQMQLEKMSQLYRFAEFGKLSSGLFHDLVNPLNAVSLNMELVKSTADKKNIAQSQLHLTKAISATKKLENFIFAVRKQISKQENQTYFSLNEEIDQVIDILSFKARQNGAVIIFNPAQPVFSHGDNIKWSQVVLNLTANAIDSYENTSQPSPRIVMISLARKNGVIVFSVTDTGCGIPQENREKIFEPFFTTKSGSGMGIGLSLVKSIIEKDFGGTIELVTEVGAGTAFIISIPHRHERII